MKTGLPAVTNPIALSGVTRSIIKEVVTDHDHALQWDDGPNAGNGGIWSIADSFCSSYTWTGFDDWRLPTVKELYSLIMFYGTDPSGWSGGEVSELTPFINTDYFDFRYGDLGWRDNRPKLAAFYEDFAKRSSMTATEPPA